MVIVWCVESTHGHAHTGSSARRRCFVCRLDTPELPLRQVPKGLLARSNWNHRHQIVSRPRHGPCVATTWQSTCSWRGQASVSTPHIAAREIGNPLHELDVSSRHIHPYAPNRSPNAEAKCVDSTQLLLPHHTMLGKLGLTYAHVAHRCVRGLVAPPPSPLCVESTHHPQRTTKATGEARPQNHIPRAPLQPLPFGVARRSNFVSSRHTASPSSRP